MTRNDYREEYESRLRSIVLHSADVLPEEVAKYLTQTQKYGDFEAQQQILKAYNPLVNHLAKDYTDFFLNLFVTKVEKRRAARHEYEDENLDADKVHLHIDFLPPAPFQGPFLYTLAHDEDEGLRLIHTLVNASTRYWRKRWKQRYYHGSFREPIHPLPIQIRLPSGEHEFWGDPRVYMWFRPKSHGLDGVVSALMALEHWMDMQIQKGRDAVELFDKVLSGSDCVATLGLCLGIAMAYVDKCMHAALPIVSSPAIWRMDIPRLSMDSTGNIESDPFNRYQQIYKLRAELDQRV